MADITSFVASVITIYDSLKKMVRRQPRVLETIVDVIAKHKGKKTFSSVFVILSALGIYNLASFPLDFSPSWSVTLVAVGFVAALTLDWLLMAYRATRGWYGTNAMEAMEILRFVASHNTDNEGNPPIKKVLRNPKGKQIIEANNKNLVPDRR